MVAGRTVRLRRGLMSLWAAQWHSKNNLDGERRHICYENCLPKLFRRRSECREWVKLRYGYIANRPDLRDEPHGWRTPQAIRVVVAPMTDREEAKHEKAE